MNEPTATAESSPDTVNPINTVGHAEEKVVPMVRSLQAKMADKHQKKVAKQREDRKAELVKNGVSEDLADQIIEQEIYKALPIDQKVMRLEHALGYVQQVFNQTMQNLSKEMVTLRENQEAIADSFDINLRAMEVMFRNLGVSDETQKSILKAIETDFFAEKEKLAAEQKPAPVSAMTEQARIEEELSVISSESKKVIV